MRNTYITEREHSEKSKKITFSAPGKVHLLGEHAVVYGKPALLATVDLRVSASVSPLSTVIARSETTKQSRSVKIATLPSVARNDDEEKFRKTIEPIVKKHLQIKAIPSYHLTISSQIPLGVGLGSSAAISASYIAALLSFLKVNWDLNLINDLTYQAEKKWHGNPSGADNATVIFGGLIWFRKETDDLKLIHQLPLSLPKKLVRNFVLINTGKANETTKEMIEMVKLKVKSKKSKVKKIFDSQEQLTKELLSTIKNANEKELIRIIRQGEKNLESIGVVSRDVESIIRTIEKAGGAAKICGGGGKKGPTGVLLCYHPKSSIFQKIAESYNLSYFNLALGVGGLKNETH